VENSLKILSGLTSYLPDCTVDFSCEVREVSLLLWQLLLNGKINHLLVHGSLLCRLVVLKPGIVDIVKENMAPIVPMNKMNEFEEIFRKIGEVNGTSRPELEFSVHLERLVEILEGTSRLVTLF
jgi:hypothetical protein